MNPDTRPARATAAIALALLMTSTTLYGFAPAAPPVPSTGGVIITELRTSGPCCEDDEYVELYNTTGADLTVQSADATAGWSLVKRGASCVDPPIVIATIPNGTFIPAKGHYLLTGSTYSLNAYPAGNDLAQTTQTTAVGDQPLSPGIQNNRNVGLFNTANPANFDAAHRLDAVAFDAGSGGTCDLLSEGGKLLAPRGSTAEHAFVRKMGTATGGVPQDTNDNAADFVLVSTNPTQAVGDNPSPVLGAPGPENTTSPVERNAEVPGTLLAPTVSSLQPPNRERRFDVVNCGSRGTIHLRRTFTNTTGAPVTRLRFRVIDITTINSPVTAPPQAVVKVLNSGDDTVFVPGVGPVFVAGLQREEPPNQNQPFCGGLNTSLSPDEVSLATPLADGDSISVTFRLGVEAAGNYRFYFNIEALP